MDYKKNLAKIPEYTEQQWQKEIKAPRININFPEGSFAFGTNLPCPLCQTVGFYGPRIAGQKKETYRKYRACKFCGFWQEAAGEARNRLGPKAYRCVAIYCPNCKDNYNWHMPDVKNFGMCQFCQSNFVETEWAADNPHHPFRKIKNMITNSIKEYK